MKISVLLLVSMLGIYSNVGANAGIDVLLNSLDVKDDSTQVSDKIDSAPEISPTKSFDLTDHFLAHLFSSWREEKELEYDVNQWIMQVLRKDFTDAAHLIPAVRRQIPDSWRTTLRAAEIYLYRQLGLGQTFVNTWLSYALNPSFLTHPSVVILSEILAKDAFDLVMDIAPILNAQQSAFLESMPVSTKNQINLALKSWANLNKGMKAAPLLSKIPPSHPMMIPMAKTVVIAHLKNGDVANAGRVLKKYLTPILNKTQDTGLLRDHYLTIARLLYQVGMLDASEEYYRKIPNNTSDYLRAQTELAWVLLRKRDTGRLRGLLTTLGHDLFVDTFNPEVYLVRSIANLKLCQYKSVHNDFSAFIDNNKKWGKKIIEEIKKENPQKEDRIDDYYISLYERSLANLIKEWAHLSNLRDKSIKAALPIMPGIQVHWKEALNDISIAKEHQKKRVAVEHRRFWKNREIVLKEAIRKMRFVKVEMMGQLQEMQDSVGFENGDKVSTVRSALDKGNQQVFPFDGIIWGDEMFHLYAEAENFCLAGGKKRS